MNKTIYEDKRYIGSYYKQVLDSTKDFFKYELNNSLKLNEVDFYKPVDFTYEKDKKLHVLVNYSGEAMNEAKLFNKLVQNLQPLGEVEIEWTPVNREKHGSNDDYLQKLQAFKAKKDEQQQKVLKEKEATNKKLDVYNKETTKKEALKVVEGENEKKERVKDRDSINEEQKKYVKTLKNNNLPYFDTEKMLYLIDNDAFPLMKKQNNINYIVNPLDLSVFPGYNQLGLQANNSFNKLNTNSYVPYKDFVSREGKLYDNSKRVSQIINKGIDKNGNYIYDVVVPCKVTREEKKEKKALKAEELRRNVFDSKFVAKYGKLPVYQTTLAPYIENQPPFYTNRKLGTSNPVHCTRVDKRLAVDMTNYFQCMFTKEPYTPCTDWTNPIWKEKLKNYAETRPEELIRMADVSYSTVTRDLLKHKNEDVMESEKVRGNSLSFER